MKKRIISMAIAIIMLVGVIGATALTAFASEEKEMMTITVEGVEVSVSADYDWERLRNDEEPITLNVFNWGEYISDGSDETLDVNEAFTQLTGIEVNYQLFANNEEMYTKIVSGGADYDLLIPSDYMIGRMINEDLLSPLDFSLIPNFELIDDKHKNLAFDTENEYYVPYTWGVVGIIYNTTMVTEEVTSWDMLWNEDYAGNILMFNNPRDAFAIALIKNGLSLNPQSAEDIQTAKETLIEQKGVVQAYVNDEIFDKMEGGEAALAPYYAGDAYTMIDTNPDLAFAVPEEGTNYFTDAMVIMENSQNKEAAHMYINFLCELEIALANADYIGYSSPLPAVRELLDDEMKNSPIIYPDASLLENTEAFTVLTDEINTEMDTAWSEVKAYSEEASSLLVPALFFAGVILLVAIFVIRGKMKKKNIDY